MIATRVFSEDDQQAFADWSGDRNPIHLDAIAARRTSAGAPVVHGMHALLWALEAALDSVSPHEGPLRLRAKFRKFIYVGEAVSLEKTSDGQTLHLLAEDGTAVFIRILPGENPGGGEDFAPQGEAIAEAEPLCPSFADMRESSGWLDSRAVDEFARAFPNLAARFPNDTVAALAALSRLVGMICPGRHSVLAAVDLNLEREAMAAPGIAFHTISIDERFRLVRMEVAGSTLRGTVEAFVRPEPVQPLSASDAAHLVRPDQFAGRHALVVGGSRGLGAVTAKLLAAGGASVTLTYATGAAEALEICHDITDKAPGRCTALPLDVERPIPEQLGALSEVPTHVYYFATPRILLQKPPEFASRAFDRFTAFYVRAFEELCVHLASLMSSRMSVLYPSSVAVIDRPKGMAEYAAAKMAGELLCEELMQSHPQLSIKVARLPRVLTDQTATIAPVDSAKAEDVLLPLLED